MHKIDTFEYDHDTIYYLTDYADIARPDFHLSYTSGVLYSLAFFF